MSELLYLPDTDLEALGIAPSAVADAIEVVLRDKAEGRFIDAPKSALLPGDARYIMSTLAVGAREDLTVLKTVSVCPANPARGLPTTNGAVLVLDAQTGLLRALMGANWITAVRTAALSTVAARRLANPKARVIAFIGCGVQAHSHLDAFAEIFPLDELRCFGRGRANAEALCKKAKAMGLDAAIADSAEAAILGADLVVTSVTLDYSIEPFLDARWLKPGAFAAITDLGIPWMPETMNRLGPVVIDDLVQEAAMERKLIDPALVDTDLTGLVAGGAPARDPSKPAAFVFRGVALGDYAAATLALSVAEAKGAGQNLWL